MARRVVVQIECSRCSRIETVEADPEKVRLAAEKKSLPIFEATFQIPGGHEVKLAFEDLCENCRTVVAKTLDGLRTLKKESPRRKKNKAEEQAPTPPIARPNGPPPPMRAPRG